MDLENKLEYQPTNTTVNNITSKMWQPVDLKILLAVLSLANPSISQAKVASLLKVSPVTLSRLVNGDDHYVRESWIPVLSDCLSNVDMDAVKNTIDSLHRIHHYLREKQQLANLQSLFEHYLATYNCNYKFDPEYWGQANNILRFYEEDNNTQWLFSLGTSGDATIWRPEYPLGPFTRFNRMRSMSSGSKVSVLYTDAQTFAQVVDAARRQLRRENSAKSFSYYSSLILCNLEEGKVIEEFIVFDPSDVFLD